MPTYEQTVRFERTFKIEAKNAEEANQKLGALVDQVEFNGDVEALDSDSSYFEDEPEECKMCEGWGYLGDGAASICPRCQGECVVPFGTSNEAVS